MSKKILVLLGHPDKETSCGHFADAYETGAREGGHEVRRINLGDLKFDPILHEGYKVVQELEPDLMIVQNSIKWADHLVIVYPTWWSTMPALLKGMFDRLWLPGFAYNFKENGLGWTRHLKGVSARVIVTSDSHPLITRFLLGDTTNEIRRGILWFSGVSPVRLTKIGGMKNLSGESKIRWEKKLWKLGKAGR